MPIHSCLWTFHCSQPEIPLLLLCSQNTVTTSLPLLRTLSQLPLPTKIPSFFELYGTFLSTPDFIPWSCIIHSCIHAYIYAFIHSFMCSIKNICYFVWTPLVFYCCCNYYHKLRGLPQQKFIIIQFCGSEVQNEFHWAKTKLLAGLCFFLEAQRENRLSSLTQLLEDRCIPWLMVPFLHLWVSNSEWSPSH